MINYKNLYLEYKLKYLNLKHKLNGGTLEQDLDRIVIESQKLENISIGSLNYEELGNLGKTLFRIFTIVAILDIKIGQEYFLEKLNKEYLENKMINLEELLKLTIGELEELMDWTIINRENNTLYNNEEMLEINLE
tara:strand:- start:742 stop:1149 length:408 start_codon:yes stop_codon:yes gene_type:complete